MALLCLTNLVFITLYFSVVLSAENEVCGQVNTEQLRNKQADTQIDEFPWMARIAYQNSKTMKTTFSCQAVLIDQKHLLAAGHCLENLPSHIEPYAVLNGDWNSANEFIETDCNAAIGKCTTPVLSDIEEIILYPFSNKNEKQNDIAILRLAQKVTYSEFIQPICLPSNDIKNKDFGSEQVILTGWLKSTKGGPKQKKSTYIFNQNDCRRKYQIVKNANITDTHLCAITCEDDEAFLSGSALMDVKDPKSKESQSVYLIGLLTSGIPKCKSGFPDVFTRVDKYLDWIKENIQ